MAFNFFNKRRFAPSLPFSVRNYVCGQCGKNGLVAQINGCKEAEKCAFIASLEQLAYDAVGQPILRAFIDPNAPNQISDMEYYCTREGCGKTADVARREGCARGPCPMEVHLGSEVWERERAEAASIAGGQLRDEIGLPLPGTISKRYWVFAAGPDGLWRIYQGNDFSGVSATTESMAEGIAALMNERR